MIDEHFIRAMHIFTGSILKKSKAHGVNMTRYISMMKEHKMLHPYNRIHPRLFFFYYTNAQIIYNLH